MSLTKCVIKSRIGVRLISYSCPRRAPIKMAYTRYDQDTSKEKPEKPPVVVMHGVFDTRSNYVSLSKALNKSTGRTILTLDSRNHGDSPHAADQSYHGMVEDLRHFTDNLKIKECIMMGHSMSAGVMIIMAVNSPDLVEKLVIIDANPIATSPTVMELGQWPKVMASTDFTGITTLAEAREQAARVLSSVVKSSTHRKVLAMNVIEVSPGNYKWRTNLKVLETDISKYMVNYSDLVPEFHGKTFDKPTLFISGRDSDWVQEKHFDDIRKILPNAEFSFVEKAGHYVHLQRPTEFLKLASEFINQ